MCRIAKFANRLGGTNCFTIEKQDEDGRIILKRVVSHEQIKPPIYEIFPLDFISEIILPIKFEDKHNFNYDLEELENIPIEERKIQILLNAEELKKMALDL